MKCESCLELLEEYLDGELQVAEQEQIGAHLITCAGCSGALGELTAEQELFARYDREVEVPPFLWTRIAQHSLSENNPRAGWRTRFVSSFGMRFAGVAALLLLAVAAGLIYLVVSKPKSDPTLSRRGTDPIKEGGTGANHDQRLPVEKREQESKIDVVASKLPGRKVRPTAEHTVIDQSDVLSSDMSYLDMDDQDTAKHIEQSQNLLRSIRNFPVSDGDEEIDVTYDKALSRRLLNENVVLRRDAEMKAKFPTKTLLADLEPFLIDIANLPDRARPEEVRVIKERVQRTEIVAALLDYQDRGTNNR